MTRVFVSYSYERDREFVSELRKALKDLDDIEVLDPASSVKFGSEIASEIRAQIEKCDIAVSMVGPDRPNILLETGIALGAGKDLLLVTSSAESLPFNLRSLPVVITSGDPKSDSSEVARRLLAMQPRKHEKVRTYSSALEMLKAYRSDPRFFDSIAPQAFEELVAEIFKEQGFKVALTGKTADAGFDILVQSPNDPRLIAVQVKKYSRQSRVSIGHVRELLGAAALNNAHVAVLVTSSSFTAGAEAMATHSIRPQLVLVTMDRLLDAHDIGSLWASTANTAPAADV